MSKHDFNFYSGEYTIESIFTHKKIYYGLRSEFMISDKDYSFGYVYNNQLLLE